MLRPYKMPSSLETKIRATVHVVCHFLIVASRVATVNKFTTDVHLRATCSQIRYKLENAGSRIDMRRKTTVRFTSVSKCTFDSL